MSNAKKCDVCGDFYEHYKYRYLIIDTNKGVTGTSIDLCPHCHLKLIDFIKPKEAADELKETDNNNPILQ